MAGYEPLISLLRLEATQLYEEGRDIDRAAANARIDACGTDKTAFMAFYGEMQQAPMREGFAYSEPTELDGIKAECDFPQEEAYTAIDADRFHGAWLGRCIGCAIGQPVEGWSAEKITEWYKNAGKYPICGFVPTVSGTERNEGGATDEKICHMPTDEDIRDTVLNYLVQRSHGADFNSCDVAEMWLHKLPFREVCTAETQAYLNFANIDGILPWSRVPNAMELMREAKVNTYLNPYREWIGAQIRADAFGYIQAGMPGKAAEAAYKDAWFSHVKNGIYGEMFFAAMIAAAFTESSLDECFFKALAVVPKKSRFYEAALAARESALAATDRAEYIAQVIAEAKKYHPVHTINNAQICISAMFFCRGDFRESVCFAIECGFDTDCNGATIGSVLGALHGAAGIPADLKEPLNDEFSTGIVPYENYSISRFAAECSALRDELYKHNA